MADLPILFSAPMVRALLREIEQPGTGKTQTRRVLNPQPDDLVEGEIPQQLRISIGDRFYVREAWKTHAAYDDLSPAEMGGEEPIQYEADGEHQTWGFPAISKIGRYRPGMFMPRWASRITLTVTDVRVQRLQDISEADAIAEGVEHDSDGWRDYLMPATQCSANARDSYRTLWDHLNDKPKKPGNAWRDNPWVAAYTFTLEPGNIDQVRP